MMSSGTGSGRMQVHYCAVTILLTSPAELHDIAPIPAYVVSPFSATYEGPA